MLKYDWEKDKMERLQAYVKDESKRMYFLLFIVGIFICFFRASYSVLSPVMYTEDGSWISALIENGLIDTCLKAKGSYLVVGNILLLQISWWLNLLFFGENLAYLPIFVALVSFFYYVLLAFFPVWLLKRTLDIKARIFLYFAILCVPMGTSISEIYGRISNIGYGCFFIAVIMMLYLFFEGNTGNIYKTAGIYLGLLFCCITNPTCYFVFAIILGYGICRGFKKYGIRMVLKWETLIDLFAGMLVFLSIILMYLNKHSEIGQESVKIVPGGLIEYLFRSLAFIFTWPFYLYMNNVYAFIILLVIIIFSVVSLWMIKDKKYRNLLFISYGATIFFTLITLFMRKTLTSQLNNYTTTFPDRYFYVQELLVLLDFSIVLSAVFKKKISNKVWKITVLGLLGLYIFETLIFSNQIFEFNHSRYIDCSVTFAEMVESSYIEQGEAEMYTIPIPIHGFSMVLPAEYVKATVEHLDGIR